MQAATIQATVREAIQRVLSSEHGWSGDANSLVINQTKPEFEGDLTLVLFGLAKTLGQAPDKIGESLGSTLTTQFPQLFSGYQLVKGFLNLSLQDQQWIFAFEQQHRMASIVDPSQPAQRILVEYSFGMERVRDPRETRTRSG